MRVDCTVKLLFKGDPWDHGKCPLNRGLPSMKVTCTSNRENVNCILKRATCKYGELAKRLQFILGNTM